MRKRDTERERERKRGTAIFTSRNSPPSFVVQRYYRRFPRAFTLPLSLGHLSFAIVRLAGENPSAGRNIFTGAIYDADRSAARTAVIGSIGRAERFDFHAPFKTGSPDGRIADLSLSNGLLREISKITNSYYIYIFF